MKKVCLIHPPHLNASDDRLDPPMGLLYIAAYLKKHNVDVSVVDLSGTTVFDMPFADVYGITVYISSLQVTKDIIIKCKEVNPKSKIVVGGAHPSACPCSFEEVDYVVVGYGEVAMLDIVTEKVKSKVVVGLEPENQFSFPSYDLVNLSSYSRKIEGKPSVTYTTSRGCPFQCHFCGLAKMHELGFGVRMAEPEIVYSHLKRLKEEFGIERINFQDDIFTFNQKRLFRMLELIKLLGIKFRCMGRAGYDTKEVYKRLADAGCVQVAYGIESGSQYILDRMKKQVTVEDNYNVIRWAKECKIVSRAFFMIGFPGETEKTIEETKQFIINADPDQIFVSNFIPYPGTKIGDCPEKFGIIKVYKDYDQYYQVCKDGTGGVVIDTKWLSKEEFKVLELEFRDWINKRPMRGPLQDYEMRKLK